VAKIEIYSTMFCPFCSAAKRLLNRKGVSFVEHDVTFRPELRREMADQAGGDYKVPQIFVDGTHIGNCDQLYALDADGRLDALLGGA